MNPPRGHHCLRPAIDHEEDTHVQPADQADDHARGRIEPYTYTSPRFLGARAGAERRDPWRAAERPGAGTAAIALGLAGLSGAFTGTLITLLATGVIR